MGLNSFTNTITKPGKIWIRWFVEAEKCKHDKSLCVQQVLQYRFFTLLGKCKLLTDLKKKFSKTSIGLAYMRNLIYKNITESLYTLLNQGSKNKIEKNPYFSKNTVYLFCKVHDDRKSIKFKCITPIINVILLI